MESLLYLAHRIPFPPNKGDKIRSFNLLKHLAGRYRIRLGCFIDDPADWRYLDDLDEWCSEVYARPLSPRSARIASLRGLYSGEALTLPYCTRPWRRGCGSVWTKASIGWWCFHRRWRSTSRRMIMPPIMW